MLAFLMQNAPLGWFGVMPVAKALWNYGTVNTLRH